MRCKLCKKTQKIKVLTHSWEHSQHCAECHFIGRVPRGRKHKNYNRKVYNPEVAEDNNVI